MARHTYPYHPESLAQLYGIRLIISPFVPDNKFVLRGNKHPIRPIGVGYSHTIWDLETGVMSGDCRLQDAQEIHMSQLRYDELSNYVSKQPGA